MYIFQIFILTFLLSVGVYCQNEQIVKSNADDMQIEADTILQDTIQLDEVTIFKGKINFESRKQFELLKNRVYKVYPYAKLASERLTELNRGMAVIKSNREKKRYFKIVEGFLTKEFEGRLKKLSRKQGQILIKLIHRQTGATTYDLVKSLKSGWSAFWSGTTAKMFDLDMKAQYLPYQVNEDYLIETILVRAFESRWLVNQPPSKPINYDDLKSYWINQALKESK